MAQVVQWAMTMFGTQNSGLIWKQAKHPCHLEYAS